MGFDSAALAQLAATELGIHWLAQFDFLSGTQYWTTFNQTITIGGHEYLGLGGLLRVGELRESHQARGDTVTLSMPLMNSAMIPLFLANLESYRGRDVRLYIQLFNKQHQPVGAPVLRFTGRMQPVSMKQERGEGASAGTVEMQASRAGMERSRRLDGRKLTDAQQRAEFPGDSGLRYVRTLIEKPALWISKKFQEQ